MHVYLHLLQYQMVKLLMEDVNNDPCPIPFRILWWYVVNVLTYKYVAYLRVVCNIELILIYVYCKMRTDIYICVHISNVFIYIYNIYIFISSIYVNYINMCVCVYLINWDGFARCHPWPPAATPLQLPWPRFITDRQDHHIRQPIRPHVSSCKSAITWLWRVVKVVGGSFIWFQVTSPWREPGERKHIMWEEGIAVMN